jgi:predicted nucleic acid-binding protein
MSVFVLDANIVSAYLKGNGQVINNIEQAVTSGDDILIAPIAYYEVRRGLQAIGSVNRMRKFEDFCRMFAVGQFDNSMLDIAADIYVELRAIGRITDDADIFIAAFCRRHGFTLITNNMRHFDNVANLNVIDWTVG